MRKKIINQKSIHFLLLISLFLCNIPALATQIVNKPREIANNELETLIEKPKQETEIEKIIEPKIDESPELQNQEIVKPKKLYKKEKRLLRKQKKAQRRKSRKKRPGVLKKAGKAALVSIGMVGGVLTTGAVVIATALVGFMFLSAECGLPMYK